MGISIIICSRNNENLSLAVASIKKTIDVDFEILSSFQASEFGLSSIYNKLVMSTKYKYLIFMHDDIYFDCFDWGTKLIKLLTEQNIGLVGLMGAKYKSEYVSLWTSCDSSLYRISLSDNLKEYSEVVTLDGCFLAMRKDVFENYYFDEKLHGFHGYDLDICLKIFSKLKIVVVNNISFNHLSEGNKNEQWFNDTIYVHNKWKSKLPVSIGLISAIEKKHSDYLSLADQFNSLILFKKNKIQLLLIYFKIIFTYFRFNKFRYAKRLLRSLYS